MSIVLGKIFRKIFLGRRKDAVFAGAGAGKCAAFPAAPPHGTGRGGAWNGLRRIVHHDTVIQIVIQFVPHGALRRSTPLKTSAKTPCARVHTDVQLGEGKLLPLGEQLA